MQQFASKIAASQSGGGVYSGAPPAGYTGGPPPAQGGSQYVSAYCKGSILIMTSTVSLDKECLPN
jgi:hypothetical protein